MRCLLWTLISATNKRDRECTITRDSGDCSPSPLSHTSSPKLSLSSLTGVTSWSKVTSLTPPPNMPCRPAPVQAVTLASTLQHQHIYSHHCLIISLTPLPANLATAIPSFFLFLFLLFAVFCSNENTLGWPIREAPSRHQIDNDSLVSPHFPSTGHSLSYMSVFGLSLHRIHHSKQKGIFSLDSTSSQTLSSLHLTLTYYRHSYLFSPSSPFIPTSHSYIPHRHTDTATPRSHKPISPHRHTTSLNYSTQECFSMC